MLVRPPAAVPIPPRARPLIGVARCLPWPAATGHNYAAPRWARAGRRRWGGPPTVTRQPGLRFCLSYPLCSALAAARSCKSWMLVAAGAVGLLSLPLFLNRLLSLSLPLLRSAAFLLWSTGTGRQGVAVAVLAVSSAAPSRPCLHQRPPPLSIVSPLVPPRAAISTPSGGSRSMSRLTDVTAASAAPKAPPPDSAHPLSCLPLSASAGGMAPAGGPGGGNSISTSAGGAGDSGASAGGSNSGRDGGGLLPPPLPRVAPTAIARWVAAATVALRRVVACVPRRHAMVALVGSCSVLNYADRVNLSVAVIPMAAAFRWDAAAQGVVLSAFFWGYAPAQLMGAAACRRWGAVRVLAAAASAWSLFTAATPAAAGAGWPWLLACRILLGLGEGVWARAEERSGRGYSGGACAIGESAVGMPGGEVHCRERAHACMLDLAGGHGRSSLHWARRPERVLRLALTSLPRDHVAGSVDESLTVAAGWCGASVLPVPPR